MRIGIDARYLSHGLVGGVHTYVASFLSALLQISREHELFLYADTKCPFEIQDLPPNVTLRLIPYGNAMRSLANDALLGRIMERDQLAVVHFPANVGIGPRNVRTILTLHDEINIMPWMDIIRGHPKDGRTIGLMTYLHWLSSLSVRRAARIVTVSDYARNQIVHYGKLPPERVVTIHSAPPPGVRRIDDHDAWLALKSRYEISRPYILADALKNPDALVRAWMRLDTTLTERFQIVFFGRRPDVSEAVHHAVTAGYAQFLVRPGWDELMVLYSNAQAFVFPSWIEGFGLPVLEAMTCGAPVIASDRGSIPEVAGDAALICDAEDDNMLAGYIQSILTDAGRREHLRRLGYRRAAQFSWGETARRLLDCYIDAAGTGACSEIRTYGADYAA